MAKKHKTSTAPAGAFIGAGSDSLFGRPRNPRLYGSHEDQIAGMALRARGCPTPKPQDDKAHRRQRVAAPVAPQRAPIPLGFRVENLRRDWLGAVAEVRRIKGAGGDYSAAATRARDLRAQLVKLDPDIVLERRTVDVSTGSETNPVKAV